LAPVGGWTVQNPYVDSSAAPTEATLASGELLVSGWLLCLALLLSTYQIVIAPTVVSLGTMVPGLLESLISTIQDCGDIAISKIRGNNIFNVLVVVGLCGVASAGEGLLVVPLIVNRDFPITMLIVLARLGGRWVPLDRILEGWESSQLDSGNGL
jgi:cation:H+ antiporter